MKGVLDATSCKWKCAAAMCERDPKFGKAFEDTAENHRTDCERSFSGHSNKPWQPIFGHSFFPNHVPWMNEDGGSELFSSTPDRLKRRVIQVQTVESARMPVGVNMGSNLRAVQTKFMHAPF